MTTPEPLTQARHRAEALRQLGMAERSDEPFATIASLAAITHAVLALSAPEQEK